MKAFRWLSAGLIALCLLLTTGVLLAPLGIQSLMLTSELHMLFHQNQLQRDILEQRNKSLSGLERLIDAMARSDTATK